MAEEAVPRALKEYTAFLWPILLAAVGGFWTWSQDNQTDRRLDQERILKLQAQCFEQTQPVVKARLALRLAEDKNLATKDALREEFVLVGYRATAACRDAGMETPIPIKESVEAEARALGDVDLRLAVFESARTSAGSAGGPAPVKSSSPLPEAGTISDADRPETRQPKSTAAIPIRLYVQYSREVDQSQAEALMEASRSTPFDGRTVSVPGIERVSRAPSRMELRCLTAADCNTAKGLAIWVARLLKRPASDIEVVSLAATYEGRGATAGNFEFWFPAS